MKKQVYNIIYDFRKRTVILCIALLLISICVHTLSGHLEIVNQEHIITCRILSGVSFLLYGLSFSILLINYIFYKKKQERISRRVANCCKVLGCFLLFNVFMLIPQFQLLFLDSSLSALSSMRIAYGSYLYFMGVMQYLFLYFIVYYLIMILKNIVNCPDVKIFDILSTKEVNFGDSEYVSDPNKIKKYILRTITIIIFLEIGYNALPSLP